MIVQILTGMVDIFMVVRLIQKEYFCSGIDQDAPKPENLLMKSLLSFNLFAILLFSIVSCSKEMSVEHGSTPGTGTNGDFYASINGNQWSADSLQLVLVRDGVVTISGLSKTGGEISMILPMLKTGTYPVGGLSLSYALYVNLLDDPTKIYSSDASNASGTITISSIDTVNHLIGGSFQLNLVDLSDNSIGTITNGVFAHIPYSSTTTQQNGTGKDTLTAVVNGVQFTPPQVIVQTTVSGSAQQLLVGGISADQSERLAILMPANITAGTYNMDFATGNYIGIYYPPTGETLLSLASGSLTIISVNTVARRIKGTFYFTASPLTSGTPANISNGYFSINY
jgi:hypothetical protein